MMIRSSVGGSTATVQEQAQHAQDRRLQYQGLQKEKAICLRHLRNGTRRGTLVLHALQGGCLLVVWSKDRRQATQYNTR